MDCRLVAELAKRRDLLVEPAAADAIAALDDEEARNLLDEAVTSALESNAFVLTESLVKRLLDERTTELKASQPVAVKAEGYEPPSKKLKAELRFHEGRDVSDNSRCTGNIQDFVSFFRNRFNRQKALLRRRRTDLPVIGVREAKRLQERERARLIGMVADKRETRNGHVIVEFEDESGAMPCLFSKKNEGVLALAPRVMLDEVVAFDGLRWKDLFIVEAVEWPEVPLREPKKVPGKKGTVGFLSDLHVGSKYFLREEFSRFLKFLNGEGDAEQAEAAGNIKYLLLAGDLVDGIGIYPTQEEQLVTKDIYEQYEALTDLLCQVPDWIELVVAPGNHDAVRTADPQPRLPSEFVGELEKRKNVHLVGDPAYVEVAGLNVLMYHGTSADTWISSLQPLRDGYHRPEIVGREMLRRRHLLPLYGEKPIVPEKKDYMVIDAVPDVFHFGHVHKNGYKNYRGTTIVNSGTWQDTTDFQLRIGHEPSPCEFPVLDPETASLKVFNFK